jgi:hypothetical protein
MCVNGFWSFRGVFTDEIDQVDANLYHALHKIATLEYDKLPALSVKLNELSRSINEIYGAALDLKARIEGRFVDEDMNDLLSETNECAMAAFVILQATEPDSAALDRVTPMIADLIERGEDCDEAAIYAICYDSVFNA